MRRYRVIPCLLLKGGGLYKTAKFKAPRYLGDPINVVRIFNDKEVDELILLDIAATTSGRDPDFAAIREIAQECFMPVCYGGGLRTTRQVEQVLRCGIEKVALNAILTEAPAVVREASREFGASTIVAGIDYKCNWLGKPQVYIRAGQTATGVGVREMAERAEELGAGEILLNSIDRDGTMTGYDLEMVGAVAGAVGVPVIACGGAATLHDFQKAIHVAGASGVAAGSMFVFVGRQRGVLITYPTQADLETQVFRAEQPERAASR